MHLYIMRHGIAFDASQWKGSEFTRPLTLEGEQRTQIVLEALKKKHELKVDEIWSSPLTRALQTAQIAGKVLNLPVTIVEALTCGATLPELIAEIGKRPLPERLLWTGHEPDCGCIVGALLGDQCGEYAFKRAGIASLEGKFEPAGMKLNWLKQPKDVIG